VSRRPRVPKNARGDLEKGRRRAQLYFAAIAEHDPVPCNGCSACCRSRNAVEIRPEHGDDLRAIDALGAVVGLEHGVSQGFIGGRLVYMLAQKGNGDCAFIDDELGCRIYADRPFGCRTFDCRRTAGPITGVDRVDAIMGHVFPLSVFQAADARMDTLKLLPEEEAMLGDLRHGLLQLAQPNKRT
jgi:Fe-S-cluster containining protein